LTPFGTASSLTGLQRKKGTKYHVDLTCAGKSTIFTASSGSTFLNKAFYLLSNTLSMLPKIKEQLLLGEQDPNISS